MPAPSRDRIAALGTISTVLCGCALAAGAAFASTQSTPAQFRWLLPAPAPAGWKHLSLPSGTAVLSYPPSLRPIKGDHGTISVAQESSSGRILLYLNATPQQGGERLDTWPAFRLARIHDESSSSVHEDAQALELSFLGGKGSCVIDDYLTHLKHNHYREIACFVRGSTSGSVVVAAALASEWTSAAALLERAVAAYRVS